MDTTGTPKETQELAALKRMLEQTIFDNERSRQAMLSIVEDEKQARQALKAQEEQYRTLVEGMNEGLIQVDNNDVIQFVNERFCRLSGYSRE
jgi:PAS domain-containing protein